MSKILSLGLAGAVAFSALVAPLAGAQAAPFHPYFKPGPGPTIHHRNNGWNNGGAFVAGTILGIAGAAIATGAYGGYPAYGPYPVYGPYPAGSNWNAHVQWCFNQYPNSYNPRTNTFVGWNGVTYYCNSPYN